MTDYLTVAEAAALLGLKPLRVRRLIRSGTLRAFKAGYFVRILAADAEALRRAREPQPYTPTGRRAGGMSGDR